MINDWQEVLYWVTIASITIANIFAVRQQNLEAFDGVLQYFASGIYYVRRYRWYGTRHDGIGILCISVRCRQPRVFSVITIVALRSQKFTLEDYAGLYKTNPKKSLS